MSKAEHQLFATLNETLHTLRNKNKLGEGVSESVVNDLDNKLCNAIIAYADATKTVHHPTRWNTPKNGDTGTVKHGRDCNDHPKVRGTDYMEVHQLIATSGCSNTKEMWTWTVLGVLETDRGRQIVNPGDWIVEPLPGVYHVYTDAQYRSLYL